MSYVEIVFAREVLLKALVSKDGPDAHGVLPKIIGGGSNRLFKVEGGGVLVVRRLNLTKGHATAISWTQPASYISGCLTNNNDVSVGGRSLQACKLACVANKRCRSIDWYNDSTTCRLSYSVAHHACRFPLQHNQVPRSISLNQAGQSCQ